MATLADYLRQIGGQINTGMQGLGPALQQGFANPLTHAGLGIMLGSQAGGAGPAAGFMQGMQGFNQFAAQQADEQDRKALRELQQAQLGRLKANDEREQATRAAVMQAMRNDPNLLGNMPLARTVLEATGDPSQLQGLSGLMPKAPEPMSEYQQGMLNLGQQRLAQQGQMTPYQQGMLDLGQQRLTQQGQTTPYQQAQIDRWNSQQSGMTPYQQAQVDRWKAEDTREATKASRETAAARQKSLISANDLDAKYQAAIAELDQYDKRLQDYVGMPGFKGSYGVTGALAEKNPIMSTLVAPDVKDAMARRKELQAQGMLAALVDLKGAGASLAPISNTDAEALKAKGGNIDTAQSAESAAKAVAEMRAQIAATKQRVTQAYQADRSLYAEGQSAGPAAPQVGEVRQGYQYVGGDPANPASWRKQ